MVAAGRHVRRIQLRRSFRNWAFVNIQTRLDGLRERLARAQADYRRSARVFLKWRSVVKARRMLREMQLTDKHISKSFTFFMWKFRTHRSLVARRCAEEMLLRKNESQVSR